MFTADNLRLKKYLTLNLINIWKRFGTGKPFTVSNPFTSQDYIKYQNSDTNNDMQKAMIKLNAYRQTWKGLDLTKKKNHISNFIQSFKKNKQNLIQTIHQSTGKSLHQCQQQVNLCQGVLDNDFKGQYKFQVFKGSTNKYIMQPVDNILVAYDHRTPALSSIKYLIQCALAGAGIILKPQRYALPTSKIIQNLWKQSVSQHPIIYCPINSFTDGLEYLVQHEGTGFVSYSSDIQSGNIFYHFMAMNSKIFAESQFFLTSNDAAYVCKDLSEQSLDRCVDYLIKGCFTAAGNYINSIQRIFIDEQISDKFLSKFILASKKYNIDQQNSLMSAIITSRHKNQVKEHLNQLLTYPKNQLKSLNPIVYKEHEKCIKVSPIIYQISGIPDVQYWTKIYPMPIVFVQTVSSIQSCIQKINQSIYGVNACLFMQNVQMAQNMGSKLQVGTVNINHWGMIPGVPYSARKRSGKGSSFSQHTIDNILRSKAISKKAC